MQTYVGLVCRLVCPIKGVAGGAARSHSGPLCHPMDKDGLARHYGPAHGTGSPLGLAWAALCLFEVLSLHRVRSFKDKKAGE